MMKIFKTLLLISGLSITSIVLSGCGQETITKEEILKDKKALIQAGKICYHLIENNSNPFSNQTCKNLAELVQDDCLRNREIIGGVGDCDNMERNLMFAVSGAKKLDERQQEDQKRGW